VCLFAAAGNVPYKPRLLSIFFASREKWELVARLKAEKAEKEREKQKLEEANALSTYQNLSLFLFPSRGMVST